MKKLYRSNTNKIFAGILGGLGEYFDMDPVLLRVIFVFLAVLSLGWPSLIVYVGAVFIIPVKI